MYFLSHAKKLDFMWKMVKREMSGLKSYQQKPQKTDEMIVRSSPMLFVTPESQGMSSAEIINFYRELSDFRKFRPHSAVIVKNGKVVSKTAWKPYSLGVRHVTHSLAKSITSLAIGIAEGEGLLSLDERLVDIFPKRFSFISSRKVKDITIKNLLMMSTGARFFEGDALFESDWIKGFIDGELKWDPGEKFEYNSINTYLLSTIISSKTGVSMTEYLETRLFGPMGIKNVVWEKSPTDIEKGGWGLYMGTEEMAKLGQLCLNKGVWEVDGQKVQLVPENYIRKATSDNGLYTEDIFGYGYQFWTMRHGYMMNGMFGQYVLVFPEQDTVVAINSGSDNLFADPELVALVEKYFVHGKARKLMPLDKMAFNRLRKLEGELEYNASVNEDCSIVRYENDMEEVEEKLKKLDGRVYNIIEQSVSVLPVLIQCMQSNFPEGIQKMGFGYDDGVLTLDMICENEVYSINAGLRETINSVMEFNGEKYLISASAQLKQDEDDDDVIKIMINFPEVTSVRMIKIFLHDDMIVVKLRETPNITTLFREYVRRNDENISRGVIETMENQREIMRILLYHLFKPRLRGRLSK